MFSSHALAVSRKFKPVPKPVSMMVNWGCVRVAKRLARLFAWIKTWCFSSRGLPTEK